MGAQQANLTPRKIEIPYFPRPFWQKILHPALEEHRFSVVVAHRRFGKTVGSVNHLVKMAINNTKLRSPRYAYFAPFLKQAKMAAWEYLKYYTASIPGRKMNETELWVELPSYFKNSQGARIYIAGADRPDAHRGTYWDGVIIDEYAQIKKEFWGEVIRPALADRHGWAVFIGTPKGQNQFYDMFMTAIKEENKGNKEWFHCLYTVDDTHLIPEDEVRSMKAEMNEVEIQQELYCDFAASAYNRLISLETINAAMERWEERKANDKEYRDSPKVMGVDVARFGDDSSVIFRRQGLMAFEPEIYHELDNMEFADKISKVIRDWDPDMVFIDSGRGEGVIDYLRRIGFADKIVEVPFGGKACQDTRYMNKRAEMWDECNKWLKSGGAIPYMPGLRAELAAPEYTFDKMNRIKLEPKEVVKEKTGKSPDVADALCLTFAFLTNFSRNMAYRRARKNGLIRKYGGM